MEKEKSINLLNLTPLMLEQFAVSRGEKPFRGRQIAQWVFEKGARDIESMTNLSLPLREKIRGAAFIGYLRVQKEARSRDGTRKFLFELEDGHTIETVVIPDNDRVTLCVSTQAGCGMGCTFCLTGKQGFIRDLSHGEIIGQVLTANSLLPPDTKITNIVLMGMGEPLDNYDTVVSVLETMISPQGMKFPAKRISLSTAGVVPAIHDLAREETVNVKLAVSLNAVDDRTRSRIMPINKKYPLRDLLQACKEYSGRKGKAVMFEYVMLGGVNDREEDAGRLAALVRGIKCKINLIPFNTFTGAPFAAPMPEAVERFHAFLIREGMTVFTRKSKGSDILAACGQLRGNQ